MDILRRIADGRTDLVFDHLQAGGAPDATDQAGVPLIRWCAYYGDVSAVRRLLEAGESLSSLGDNLDLNGAAFHGWWRLCQFLLENGAHPNHALPDTGETPLHAALSKRGRPSYDHVVAVLLAAGADPNRAALDGAPTGAFMRDARTRGETPLHRAAAFGSLQSIRQLLDAGADVEAKDARGDTPLAWASWGLRPRSVLRMLCYGEVRVGADLSPEAEPPPGWDSMDVVLQGKPHV